MTLNEAIKHAEEVAEEKESEAQDLEYSKLDWKYEANKCSECAKEHRQLSEWLKELKQLREQTRWILVSERLPKVADCYAVTKKIGNDLITSACLFDGIGNWHNDHYINQERNYLTNIVAWMPLPAPFEPQEERDKE